MKFFLLFAGLAFGLVFLAYGFAWLVLAAYISFLLFACFAYRREALLSVGGFVISFALYFSVPKSISGSLEATGIVLKAAGNYAVIGTFRGVFYLSLRQNGYEIGDVLRVSGSLSALAFPHYQESFDFAGYLNSKKAFAELNISQCAVIFRSPFRLRSFKESLLQPYSASAKLMISAMVFDQTPYGLSGFAEMQTAGLGYFFGVSGFQLSFAACLLRKALGPKANGRLAGSMILAWFATAYALSGFALSILRVLLMELLRFRVIKTKKLFLTYIERLSLTGTAVLLIAPLYVLDKGFFFCFPMLAVFGFAQKLISRKASYRKTKTAILLFICVLPLNMILNYGVSPFLMPAQLALTPLLSMLYIIDSAVFLGPVSVPFLDKTNYAFSAAVDFLGPKLNLFIPSGRLVPLFALFFYLMLLAALYLTELNLGRFAAAAKLILAAGVILCFMPNLGSRREVHFIDVGQGDSTLIRYQQTSVLIDTGGSLYSDLACQCLIPYFRSLKLTRLDAVITTHNDFDHVGALKSLACHFPVNEIIENNTKEKIDIGPLSFIDLNRYKNSAADSNYNSSVFFFSLCGTSFLVTGDAPKSIELKIIDDNPELKADVLKVGHHGSDTSTSERFLRTIRPRLAIISCGYENSYGHPSPETLILLRKEGIPFFRTDLGGTYVYYA